MGTSARQFAATYDHHELDAAVRRGQAEYASLVGPHAAPPPPPPPPPPPVPIGVPLYAQHGVLVPPPPLLPRQQARTESEDDEARSDGGGGSGSPAGAHALALYGMEAADDVVARLAAAHPKRQKRQLALGTCELCVTRAHARAAPMPHPIRRARTAR